MNQWTWISGDNVWGQAGVYGPKGVSAASNKIGARAVSVGWIDVSDNLWLFSGTGTDAIANDIWQYKP